MIFNIQLIGQRITDDVENASASMAFEVVTDMHDGLGVLKASADLPNLRGKYRYGTEIIPNLWCNNIDYDRTNRVLGKGTKMKALWKVTASYGQNQQADPRVATGDPPASDDPFTISSSTEYVQVSFEYDANGERVCNTAGDPFSNPPMRQKAIEVFEIQRREYVNPIAKKMAYSNRINGSAWCGFPPKTLLLTIGTNFNGGWLVNYKIKYDPATWDYQIASRGYNQIVYIEEERAKLPITDNTGAKISTPAYLDPDGKMIPNNSSQYYEQVFQTYLTANFSALNLPYIA